MNDNQFTIVREDGVNKPDTHKMDSISDRFFKDCQKKSFHTYEYRCIYDICFTKNIIIENLF